MKIQFFFLLLPCVAGFFWLLAYLLFASRGEVFRRFKQFLTVVSLFLLFTLLSINDDTVMLLQFTLFKQVCALLIIPYYIKYIYALQGKKPSSVLFTILALVPYVQLVVGIESVFSVGYDNAKSILIDSYTFQGPMFPYLPGKDQIAFYGGYTYLFKTLILADFMLFSISLMKCAVSGACSFKDVLAFLFKKKAAPIRPIQFFLGLLLFLIIVSALILGKSSYIENIPLAAAGSFAIAFLLSLIAFVGTAGTVEYDSIPGIKKTVRFGKLEEPDDIAEEDVEDDSDVQKADEQVAFKFTDAEKVEALNKLREVVDEKLETIVVGEQLFLKHDLTLAFAADRIGVLKDELSDYIAYKYGMSFQNYINMLRVNYAEQYLLSHDDATQKVIALACGFSGASSFNSAFSKQNGVTPKIWKDRQLESQKSKKS